MSDWFATDDYQWCKKENDFLYHFIELTMTGIEDSCVVCGDHIDLKEFDFDQLENQIKSFGYNSLEDVVSTYGVRGGAQIIAECIFENEHITSCELQKMFNTEDEALAFIKKYMEEAV